MHRLNFRIKKYLSLDFYYAVIRKDWQKSTIMADIILKTLAILVISVHRFMKDRCTVSASALTFYSVLSFVPIVALALGIARGFGAAKVIENQLREQSFADPRIIDFVVQFANQALENTKGGLIAGLGIVILLWSVIKVLGNTELAMNRIWGVKKGRSFTKKFTDYLSIMFIAPILVILISSVNVFLTSNLQAIVMEEGFLRYAGSVIIALLNLVPFILVWLLFIFLYMFMPTTPIRFKHAVVAGIVAGSIYQIVQWFYIRFQIGVSSYNAVYGSLAALPLLLAWLQLSWCIVLWGTELCFILRNRHCMYRSIMDKENQWMDNVDIAVKLIRYITSEYMSGHGASALGMISRTLKISVGKLRVVLEELTDRKVLAEIKNKDEISYLPLIDLHTLSLADIIIRLSSSSDRKEKDWEKRYVEAIRREFGEEKFA